MSRSGHDRIRLDDVARLAGVSRSTASRVLSGAGEFSASAETAVLEASRRLGYQVDPTARALATGTPALPDGRGGRIVVCVVGPTRVVLDDLYVGRAVAAVAETAQGFGAGVSLEWLPLGGRDLGFLATAPGVRGVILFNTVEPLLAGLPRTVLGRVVSVGIGSPQVPRFSIDTAGAAELMATHLLASGRREVAMVTGPPWLPCVQPQSQGYIDVVSAAGLEPRLVPGDFTSAAGAAGALAVLRRWLSTDAVFTTCDATALGVLSVLRRRGVRVPDDVAVAGFDDIPFAAQSSPTLTTATHPVARSAASAALSLLEPAVADSLPHHFGSELVLRESA